MKMLLVFLLSLSVAQATVVRDDSDLAGLEFSPLPKNISSELTPDEIEMELGRNNEAIHVSFHVRKDGQTWKLPTNRLPNVQCSSPGTKTQWKYTFDEEKFKIQNRNRPYTITQTLECGHNYNFIFDHDSQAGQVVRIWEIFAKAEKMLRDIGRIDFWKKEIPVQWPGSGDYYSWGGINITKGHHWDVVGHELGHAIYDQAKIGSFGGGPHRIDECYSDALALSEGWASYFSAWLSLALDDEDAKFEYLVPRRAPIQIENVPSDVCAQPTNEWRVSSFLWDLIDLHDDGESADKTFQELWDMTLNKRFRSVKAMATHLRNNGWDPILVGSVWKLNFLQDL